MNTPRDFAQIIRAVSKYRTPNALAWALGVTTQTIYRWRDNGAATATGYAQHIIPLLQHLDEKTFEALVEHIQLCYQHRHRRGAFFRLVFTLAHYGNSRAIEQEKLELARELPFLAPSPADAEKHLMRRIRKMPTIVTAIASRNCENRRRSARGAK